MATTTVTKSKTKTKTVKPPATSAEYNGHTIVSVPTDKLLLDPDNARKHDQKNLDTIRKSLEQFGQVEPLVVQKTSGIVIGGNGRLQVLRQMKIKSAQVILLDIDNKRRKALAIALNRTAELAEWNDGKLAASLAGCQTAGLSDVTGFTDNEIENIIHGAKAEAHMDAGGDANADLVMFDENFMALADERAKQAVADEADKPSPLETPKEMPCVCPKCKHHFTQSV